MKEQEMKRAFDVAFEYWVKLDKFRAVLQENSEQAMVTDPKAKNLYSNALNKWNEIIEDFGGSKFMEELIGLCFKEIEGSLK